ncbi:MAG: hypothetical protein RL375_2708 [Pseudomonadota bacterium]|jgi:hypothetical protein
MNHVTMNLRLCAALAAAWFMVAQATEQVRAALFPQVASEWCGASWPGEGGDVADSGGAHHLAMLAGLGMLCPMCGGPSTPPPPWVVGRVPAPVCLYQVPAPREVAAPVLGREPMHVRARGPPAARAPRDAALVA